MSDVVNPAGRLYHWFAKAIEVDQVLRSERGRLLPGTNLRLSLRTVTILELWSRTFGLSWTRSRMSLVLVEQIGILEACCADVQKACDELPKGYHSDLLMHGFADVLRVVDLSSRALTSPTLEASRLRRPIRDAIPVLERIDSTLSERGYRDGIAVDRLRDLRDQVDALRSDLASDTSLDDELKVLIDRRLTQILDAIQRAYLAGAAPLRDAAEALMGAVQLEPDLWARISQSRWGPRMAAVWLGLMTTLGGVGAAVPVLLPDHTPPPPAIEVPVSPSINVQVEIDTDGDVVDAELVDDVPDREVQGNHEPTRRNHH